MVGFDIDVAAQFARDTGRGMYFVPLRWPRLREDANAQSFDVAMSGVTIRADRLPHMLFSRPYAVTGAVVAVRRERAAELASLEQIDRPGVRIAVNRGGHLEGVARTRFRRAEILTVDDNRTLADRVLRGEVDGAVSEQLEVAAWPVGTFAVVGPFTRDRKAYAVIHTRPELLRQLNEWLAARERDGWLNDQRRHWLSSTSVWTADEACFEAIAAAIDLRMQLMPQVAAAKRQRNLPIEDPAQEQKVLLEAVDWAKAENLDPAVIVALFERLIVAAKDRQRSVDARATLLADADLKALREAIAFYSRDLVAELGRCQSSVTRGDAERNLEMALRGSEAFRNDARLAAELASILAHPYRAPTPLAPMIAADAGAGTYIEFCIPPNLRFDREGYSIEEMADGAPLPGAPRRELASGRTRVRVTPGRHQYWFYVNGSSSDPHRAGGSSTMASRVEVEVPQDHAVAVRLTPTFSASGQHELHWQDVYGAAVSGLETYRGLTRFDVDMTISAPISAAAPSPCPW
jgi:cyclohexadienyl dehydratase